MEFINTDRLFLDVARHKGQWWLRWGAWRWQGTVFRNRALFEFTWFGEDGELFVHAGPLVFGFIRDDAGCQTTSTAAPKP